MSYGFNYFKGNNLDRLTRVKNKVIEVVENLDWDDTKIDVSKNWVKIHFFTAGALAHLLALKRKENAELAAVAGLLHDVGLIVNMGMESRHAANGYEKSKEILKEVGRFDDEEIELIANAVAKHSEKDKIGNWLEELIKDVDVLDCTLHGSDFSNFKYHYDRWLKVSRELGL